MDYYEILGVSRNANQDEIKKAFRKQAHKLHPDKTGGDDKKFKEVNEAYQVLSDSVKRQQYDQYGRVFDQGAPGGGPFGGFSWEDIARQGQGQGAQFDFGDVGDIFGEFFGFGRQGRGQPKRPRGRDVTVEVTLDFKEALFGVKKEVRLSKQNLCTTCSGNGAEPGTQTVTCTNCQGSGSVITVKRTLLGNIQTTSACEQCHGTGKKIQTPCRHCHGRGVVRSESKLEVSIPAGIDDGETLRLTGQGEAGPFSGTPGDLYVTIRVQRDPVFVREGHNLLASLSIPLSQATLGGVSPFMTHDGNIDVKIPAGIQSGTVLRMQHMGVPFLQKQGRGDLLIKVQIKTPTHLSKKQRELIEKLKEEGL
jgi:molecular chaperone DnaJ